MTPTHPRTSSGLAAFRWWTAALFIVSVFGGSFWASPVAAQLAVDTDTTLLLPFDGSAQDSTGKLSLQEVGLVYEEGAFGQAARFDATTLLEFSAASVLTPGEGSLEFWFRPDWPGNNGIDQCFLSVGDPAPGSELLLIKDGGNNFRFLMGADDSEGFQGHGFHGLQAEEWHHVAVTWLIPTGASTGVMTTYLDGRAVIQHQSSSQDLASGGGTLSIGRRAECALGGLMDDLRISSRARSAEEIATAAAQGGLSTGYSLQVLYVIPSDLTYEPAVHQRLRETVATLQGFYRCATGGLTWRTEPDYPADPVQVVWAQHPRQHYLDNGNWWGSLPAELASRGFPIGEAGVVVALFARGAGWWAGASQLCGGNCGQALMGIEGFPEFNVEEYSGSACPTGTGVGSWPCVPEGAAIHELGHTVGLPHPFDVSETNAVAAHSVMQTHWNYPNFAAPEESPWGLLTLELQTLAGNPFLHDGLWLPPEALEASRSCSVVNLPELTSPPALSVVTETAGAEFSGSVQAPEAGVTYSWDFGDGEMANGVQVVHTYSVPGSYSVRVTARSEEGMMGTASAMVQADDTALLVDSFEVRSLQRWND